VQCKSDCPGAGHVREGRSIAHIAVRTAIANMPPIPQLADHRVLRPAETALALNLVSRMDFLRLKTIARLHARGLPPDVTWDDLLQEAFTRVLVGSRRQPQGVTMVAFLAGVMRSLRSEHWRRARRGLGSREVRIDQQRDLSREVALHDPAPDPERSLIARQELSAIERLFAGDPAVRNIIAGLAEGRSAAQIRAATGISKTDYDSARKRMRRALLREGLTCAQN
jgi:DNA-directed RNA polymerase specialized sigma24 family protein